MTENRQKDIFKWVIIGLLGVIAVFLVLAIGIKIGEKKARFFYHCAENYHRMFAGPRGGFFGDWRNFPDKEFIQAHGNFGEIIETKENELVIKGRDVEKVILITKKTIIQKRRENIKKEDLKVGNFVVVIGSPNEEGKIEAKIIRVFEKEKSMPFRPLQAPFF